MNEKMYKKVNEEVAAKFKNAAAWIVDNECTEFDKTPIVGIRRDNLIDTYSDDGIHRQQIILDHSVDIGDNVYTLVNKSIPIKYCPFCGEKL